MKKKQQPKEPPLVVREEQTAYMRFERAVDELFSIPSETTREIVKESKKEQKQRSKRRSTDTSTRKKK